MQDVDCSGGGERQREEEVAKLLEHQINSSYY
jgi:hypothetical protein